MAKKLFIGNLSWNLRTEDLRAAFEGFGEITDCIVMMDRDNPNRSRGFGFVEFANEEDADSAMDEMNEKELDGRNLLVNIARAREER